jgi:hypothetical protein
MSRRGSHIFQTIGSQMAVRLSALRIGPPLPAGRFLVLLLEAQSIPGHIAAGRIRLIEKSNDLIGNGTRELPACSIVPQSTTLPRVSMMYRSGKKTQVSLCYHLIRSQNRCRYQEFPERLWEMNEMQSDGRLILLDACRLIAKSTLSS